jgi:predicted kinase
MAKIVPQKPALVLLYGFPGCGKTYFARQFCEAVQAAHVHSDRIRAELFEKPRYDRQENAIVSQLMNYMTEEFLAAGMSVVYDMNAMRAQQRLELREMARRGKATPLVIWFQMDPDTAFARSTKRDHRRADDRYSPPIDYKSFETIITHMQNPSNAENYQVVSGKHTFPTQFAAVAHKMRQLGLVGINDENAHTVKPGLVNLIPSPNAGRVDMSRRDIRIM